MPETHRSRFGTLPRVSGRLFSGVAVAIVALGLASGCEDNGLGRSCSLGEPLEPAQGGYITNATDCPTRMCVKPAVQQGASLDIDTGAYCSQACTADSDCQGQTRDPSNPNDRRCKRGYTCDIAFGPSESVPGGGKLCCQKICLCKDFYPPSQEPAVPEACQNGADAVCSSVQRD